MLTDYRLTWDINSAAWGWNIDSSVDVEEVRKFTSSIASAEANETGYTGRVKISAETGGEVKAGLSFIGIPHLSINGSAKMGFDKDKSSFLSNTSRTELKNISEAISLYSKRVHLSKMHLSFTVTFSNLTDEDIELKCTSVPVRCKGEHFVDATPVQGKETITIPGGRPEGIDVMFRAELDTTKAISLINAMQENNLEINILRGQIKVLTKDGADLISETNKKSTQTNRLDICISDSVKSILSWRVSNGNELGVKISLKAILELINQKQTDENGTPLFKIDGDSVSGVGILPIVGNKAMLLAISGNETELLSDIELSKPMSGDLTILCMLTTCYSSAPAYKKYVSSSVVAGLLKLAEKDNQNAQLELGCCYDEGYGVAKDKAMAVKWYRKAAEQGNALGQANLGAAYQGGLGVTKDEVMAVKWYRKSAAQECPAAQALLGVCYMGGLGVTKDEAEAVKWFRKAAEQGDALGQWLIGLCYIQGIGVSKDESEAVKWFLKAAAQELTMAQAMLAACYRDGKGIAKDYAEAVKWFRRAAELGDADAQAFLGDYYYIAKDMTRAVEWHRKAADQGNANSQFNMGLLYQQGIGVFQDQAEAVKWYRKAADQGNAEAQNLLGVCYHDGEGVAKDMAKAIELYRKAAEQGYASAQFNLGICYFTGEGVAKDMAKAIELYRKAAEQGYALGQAGLGDYYFAAKDMVRSAEWYRKAAEQGNANSQFSLGTCYLQGLGVTKDEAEAVKWFRKAAEQGSTLARDVLRLLGK